MRSCYPLTQPPSWKTTPCWLSTAAYSIYLWLPSISGGCPHQSQAENVTCHGDRDPVITGFREHQQDCNCRYMLFFWHTIHFPNSIQPFLRTYINLSCMNHKAPPYWQIILIEITSHARCSCLNITSYIKHIIDKKSQFRI